jgi:hypothetical protein
MPETCEYFVQKYNLDLTFERFSLEKLNLLTLLLGTFVKKYVEGS